MVGASQGDVPSLLGSQATIDPVRREIVQELQYRLLALLGRSGSLEDAARQLAWAVQAAWPDGLAVVEVVRAPHEIAIQCAPALPAGFAAAAYPALISAAGAVPSARALQLSEPVDEVFAVDGDAGHLGVAQLAVGFGLRGAWAVPALRAEDGLPLGALSVYWVQPRPAQPADVALLRLLAEHWASALHGFRAGRELVASAQWWRRDLAGVIHDEALQALVAVDLRLQRLAGRTADPTITQLAQEARHTCAEASSSLHALLVRLRPVADAALADPGHLVRQLASVLLAPAGVEVAVLDEFARPIGPTTSVVFATVLGELFERCAAGRGGELTVTLAGDDTAIEVRIDAPRRATGDDERSAQRWRLAHVLVSGTGGVLEVQGAGERLAVRFRCPLLG